MKSRVWVLLAAGWLAACATAPAPVPLDPASVEFQIESTVLAMYNVVSGPAGRHDWDRFKELFAPGARLIATPAGAAATVRTPDEYATATQTELAEHALFQHPVATRIERAGDIAQVFSTFESRHASSDAAPYARGVNSIQLVRSGDRWVIVSVLTEDEDAAHPIPAAYLPRQ
jgi:hypothetical protein